MTVHAVVYSKPNCVKCRMTEEKLRNAMRFKVEHLFTGQNDSWSDRKLDKFRMQGYQSFPVVRIYDDETGKRLDEWCDFRIDRIQHWLAIAKDVEE